MHSYLPVPLQLLELISPAPGFSHGQSQINVASTLTSPNPGILILNLNDRNFFKSNLFFIQNIGI